MNINVQSAVEQCLEIVDNEEDIIVDVLSVTHVGSKPEQTVTNSAIHNFMDGWNDKHWYTGTNSIQDALRAYPNIDLRFYI